ncbi:MAG TPA: FAD-dependent oxidoreductase [Caulobacteraceae bacterium]|jgi:3-phenylpropionate/trans-cinnamate dioxygenase ferredoxin reductase subunit
MSDAGVIIVGAGHGGGTAAALLRQYGYAAPIRLIGEEPIAPYQRPPLSKAWLKGEADEDALTLKPESFYPEAGVELMESARVEAIDAAAKSVQLVGGERFAYDQLIIATGAKPRTLPLPGADLDGVLTLRSVADAEALKSRLGPGKRIAVVGGGYIGLEVAASARYLGAEAVVIEKEAQILARVACRVLSDFFTAYHRDRGVTFELAADVTGFAGVQGRVTGVTLGDGRTIECDVALVGVGAPADDNLARQAGLACDGGILVDIEARTSDPSIFAIGDVTRRPMPQYGGRMFRLESVANALEQARHAASAITGRPPPPPEVTWNWSDQYDLKYQFAGVPFDVDQVLVRGDPAGAKFAVFHLKDGVIQAVEAVNGPAEFMGGRLLIGQRKPIDPARLADVSVSMKEVAAPSTMGSAVGA